MRGRRKGRRKGKKDKEKSKEKKKDIFKLKKGEKKRKIVMYVCMVMCSSTHIK